MARKRKDDGDTLVDTDIGDMDADTFQSFVGTIIRLKNKIDEATSEYRTERKRFEERGGDLKALAMFEKLRKLDAEEVSLRLKTLARYAAWMEMPWGTQADLFGSAPIETLSSEQTERAKRILQEETGELRGEAGDGPDENPHEPGTVEFVAWEMGRKKGFKKFSARQNGGEVKPKGRKPKIPAVHENLTGSPLN